MGRGKREMRGEGEGGYIERTGDGERRREQQAGLMPVVAVGVVGRKYTNAEAEKSK